MTLRTCASIACATVLLCFSFGCSGGSSTPPTNDHGTRWYNGGHLSDATKIEWRNNTDDEEKLATANDFGVHALVERFGTFDNALDHLGGTMKNFYRYAVEIRSCINDVANSSDAFMHDDESINFPGRACADRIVNTEIK